MTTPKYLKGKVRFGKDGQIEEFSVEMYASDLEPDRQPRIVRREDLNGVEWHWRKVDEPINWGDSGDEC